eukprot:TRINITY_DN69668_c0_g1_i1.p1 TRINITY_DN69668_c0_g1~~TRINITY_DN69668_c0_g1_i1.p1  ORF type:complete len:149 (+),score=90.65 TRINITY_DN69668_c0_g1_i1:52-498(+)
MSEQKQEVENWWAINVPAKLDDVWNRIKTWHKTQDVLPKLITSLEVLDDKADGEVGAHRMVNGTFDETLRSIEKGDKHASFSYTIDHAKGTPLDAGTVYVTVAATATVDDETHLKISVRYTAAEGADDMTNAVYSGMLAGYKESCTKK